MLNNPTMDPTAQVAALFEKFDVAVGRITVATTRTDHNGEHIEQEVVVCSARRIPKFYADTYAEALAELERRIEALPISTTLDDGAFALDGFDG